MKITRYTQSCMLIQENNSRILIDPGDGLKDEGGLPDELKDIDAIFYTHQHADHYDSDIHAKLVANRKVKVYANESHAKIMSNFEVITVKHDNTVNLGDLSVRIVEIKHCLLPDGSEGPQNIGYIINETFLHPGDGKELENETVDVLAVPITGPDISMKDAFAFAQQVEAHIAIPIHFDKIGAYPEVYKAFSERFPFTYSMTVLGNGESLTV